MIRFKISNSYRHTNLQSGRTFNAWVWVYDSLAEMQENCRHLKSNSMRQAITVTYHITDKNPTWIADVIFNRDYLTTDTIAHEATHAAWSDYKERYHKASMRCMPDEERFAYINSWYLTEIVNGLHKRKLLK